MPTRDELIYEYAAEFPILMTFSSRNPSKCWQRANLVGQVMDPVFKHGYGVAHAGKLSLWVCSELLFAFFLTEVCKLTPGQMAVCLGVSMLLNAASDIVFGVVFSKDMKRLSSVGGFQLLGAGGCAVSLCLFSLTPYLDLDIRPLFALATVTAFRIWYSVYDQPQNILIPLLTNNDPERVSFVTLRFIYGGGARLMIAALFTPVFLPNPADNGARPFFILICLLGVFSIGSAGLLTWLLGRTTGLSAEKHLRNGNIRVRDPGLSWPAWRLFVLVLIASGVIGVWLKLEPYYARFVLTSHVEATAVMTSVVVGSTLSQFIWQHVGAKMSLNELLRLALIVQILAGIAFFFVARLGLAGALLGGMGVGLAQGGIGVGLWGLMGAVANHLEPRIAPSWVAGGFSALSKTGHALSFYLAGLILSAGNYRNPTSQVYALELGMVVSVLTGSLLMLLLIWPGLRRSRSL